MQITGNTYRSLSDQTGIINYSCNLLFSSVNNISSFGFSGNNCKWNLDFISGKVYDINNNFIYSYNNLNILNISGSILKNKYDIFINNNLIESNQDFSSTGIFNEVFIKTNSNLSSDLYINGSVPTYNYETGFSYYEGVDITGYIINTSPLLFKIFSGIINDTNESEVFLKSWETNNISGSGKFVLNTTGLINKYVPLKFYTNFGDLDFNVNVSGINVSSITNYINTFPAGDSFLVRNDKLIFTNNYKFESGIKLDVSLNHISGSGTYYALILGSGSFAGLISGVMSGFGIFASWVYTPISGSGGYLGNIGTGIGSGYATGYSDVTGVFNYSTSNVIAQGIASGIGFTGLATGYISGYKTGIIISTGSGYAEINEEITGSLNGYASSYTSLNTGYAYDFINEWVTITGNNWSGEAFPYYAFDTSKTSYSWVGTGLFNSIKFSFDSLKQLNEYELSVYYYSDSDWLYNPYNIRVSGSTNDSTWSLIDSRTGMSFIKTGSLQSNTFSFYNDTFYKYYTFLFSGNTGQYSGVTGISLTEIDLKFNKTGLLSQTPFTGTLSAFLYSTGFITITGYQSNVIGYVVVLDHYKTFTGEWNLETGHDINQLTGANYLNKNWYNLSGIYTNYNILSGITLENNNTPFYIGVSYNDVKSNDPMIAKLIITGLNYNTGIIIDITGKP